MVVKDLPDGDAGRQGFRGLVRNLDDCVQRAFDGIGIRFQAKLHPRHPVQRLLEDTINPVEADSLEHLETIALIETRVGLALGTDFQRGRVALRWERRQGRQAPEFPLLISRLTGDMTIEVLVALCSADSVVSHPS